MNTSAIQSVISNAKAHELETQQLAQQLAERISHLHRAIQLPINNSVPALLNFIIRYIEHVPEFLDAVSTIADEAGILEHTQPVINVAQEFFLNPPDCIEDEQGLSALMDEAYLAHRLIEEINDRYMFEFGTPLVPMDMTRSNLIIHHLIGEPFANQLDDAVHATVDHLNDPGNTEEPASLASFLKERCDHLGRDMARWPCLTDSLSINLMLDSQSSRITLH